MEKGSQTRGCRKNIAMAGSSSREDPATVQVLFSTPATTQNAVLRLHAHVFKGSLLSVVLKKRLDTLAKSSGTGNQSRAVVRNLLWNVRASHGPPTHIDVS